MPDHFAAHGFKRPQEIIKKDKVINVGQLDDRYHGKKEVNLTHDGYDKLLGSGTITTTKKIIVKAASQKAIDKIAAQGGEVKIE